MSGESSGDTEPRLLVLLPVLYFGVVVGGAVGHLFLSHAVPGEPAVLTELVVSVGSITAGMTTAAVVADAYSRKTWSSAVARALAAAVGAVAAGVAVAAAFVGYVAPWDAGTATASIVVATVASAAAIPFLVRVGGAVRSA